MATRDAKDPLAQQVPQGMPDLAGLPVVHQTLGEPVEQPILALGGLQQHGAPIRGRLLLIKGRDEGPVDEIREEDRLWYRLRVHRKRLRGRESLSLTALHDGGGGCVSTEIGPFTNNPG